MNRRREKLINATLFFATNTNNCFVTKIMKLINFFEFEHFSQVGIPPIGLIYHAYPQGPLAIDFWSEINKGALTEDFNQVLELEHVQYSENVGGYKLIPKLGSKPDMSVFTPRELNILQNIAERYRDEKAVDMSNISHSDKLPWKKTVDTKGMRSQINYLDAIGEDSGISKEQAKERLDDFNAVGELLSMYPSEFTW